MESFEERKKRAARILRRLKKEYPQVDCTLDFQSPLELLVATILSAQCTDRRVNEVVPALFARFRTPADYVAAGIPEIERMIRSTGFYHNKAKNIWSMCKILNERYDGRVPNTLAELTELPGVGRKTANVVLENAFGIVSGIVVDTHVGRISRRLALSDATDPGKVETDLCALFPKKEWIDLSHRLIQLGRGCCRAPRPNCADCFLRSECPTIE